MIAGGVRLKTKVKSLYDCQKACEVIPLCFAGDYNPWEKSCYLHGEETACNTKATNQQTIHFSKLICDYTAYTTRSLITLGQSIANGIEQKHVTDVKSCLDKCLTTGGGIASTTANIATENQICFGFDFDFSTHKCFLHVNSNICNAAATIVAPATAFANAGRISVQLCPRAV
jgi:hypothetical protein